MGAAVATSIAFGLAACDDPDDPFDGRDDVIDVDDVDDNSTPRIIVGTNDVRSRVRDAVLRLQIGSGYCTGTLVGPDLVLTAAHCFAEPPRHDWADGGWHNADAPIVANFGPDRDAPHFSVSASRVSQPPLATGGPWLHEDIALVELDADVPSTVAIPRAVALDRPEALDPLAATAPEQIFQIGYGGFRDRRIGTGHTYVDWLTDPSWLANAFTYTPGPTGVGPNIEDGDSGGPMVIGSETGPVFGVLSHWDPYGIATFGTGDATRPSIRAWLQGHLPAQFPDFEIVSIAPNGCTGSGGTPTVGVTIRNRGGITGASWVDVFEGLAAPPNLGDMSDNYLRSRGLDPMGEQIMSFAVGSNNWVGWIDAIANTGNWVTESNMSNNVGSARVALPDCSFN